MSVKRINTIDWFKGLLICCVMLIHSNTYLHLNWDFNIIFTYFIQLAVPMFMILSGYTFSISCSKKNNIKDNYKHKVLITKIARFVFPVIIEEFVWIMARIISGQKEGMWIEILKMNCGPGSYYFMLIIELVLIFPFIYHLIFKIGGYAVWILIICNFLFEIFATISNLPAYLYARSIFAFIGFVGTGCWIFFRLQKKKGIGNYLFFCTAILGIAWIYLTLYIGYKPIIFTKNIIYSLPVLLWVWNIVYGIIYIGYTYSINLGTLGNILTYIGQASYHILCTQMIWFIMLNWLRMHITMKITIYWWVFIGVVVSIISGLIFSQVESRLTKRILRKIFLN